MVMQRLHQADLVGEVLDRGPWEVLSLPAIAEKDERYSIESPLGNHDYVRRAGEALHPERDSAEIYRKIREAVGEYIFPEPVSAESHVARGWTDQEGVA
jgi:hypothetical protein